MEKIRPLDGAVPLLVALPLIWGVGANPGFSPATQMYCRSQVFCFAWGIHVIQGAVPHELVDSMYY